jgi:hypothetical protein
VNRAALSGVTASLRPRGRLAPRQLHHLAVLAVLGVEGVQREDGPAVTQAQVHPPVRGTVVEQVGHRRRVDQVVVFHFTPVPGSWLNQVEMFFSVLTRRLLKRDDFASVEAFIGRVGEWMGYYNREKAHPYRWTYAGTPLVRDTPFEQTRRQQKRGRAFFSPRPKCFERLLFAPRPYHKAASA